MIGALIGIIITLIIVGVVYWAITQLLPLIPLPEPFARIIHVLMIVLLVIVVLWVILKLLGAAGVGVPFRVEVPGGATTTLSTQTTRYLQGLLT